MHWVSDYVLRRFPISLYSENNKRKRYEKQQSVAIGKTQWISRVLFFRERFNFENAYRLDDVIFLRGPL